MKHVTLFLFFLICLLTTSVAVTAQQTPQPENATNETRRPNLLAELGLSPEQVQQIRRMNQANHPAKMDAQRRMQEANRDLDLAIYSETVSEAEFQRRLKDFQDAQAELVRLRFEGELAVRKILTPEQLVRFRELRRRFAELRQSGPANRRRGRRGDPLNPGGFLKSKRPIN